MIKDFKITTLDEDSRIDKWLKRKFSSLKQSFIEKNLRKGFIKVNQIKIKASYKVLKNDIVNIINYSKDSYPYIVKKIIYKNIPKKLQSKFNQSIIFENEIWIIACI